MENTVQGNLLNAGFPASETGHAGQACVENSSDCGEEIFFCILEKTKIEVPKKYVKKCTVKSGNRNIEFLEKAKTASFRTFRHIKKAMKSFQNCVDLHI